MDYNIKFEYKGIGKAASNTRQKVIQAQKAADKRPGASIGGGNKETITSIKSLNSSINKLIASNKQLASAVGGGRGAPIASAGGGAGRAAGAVAGGAAGFGRIGASIPVIGAAIATLGFTIQKVNQIGNAYIEKTSQQFGTTGVGGFRYAKGLYTGAERGAGMKAYGMATGRFAKGAKTNQAALDVGTIFGMSAQETLGQAGTFKRAGASYGGAAFAAAGAGIQTEIPTLLTGMAGIMEEAIRNGMDASEMSRDMGKNLIALANKTSSKSVDAAINIVKSFQGIQKQVGEGKFGGMEEMLTARASREMLMEQLTGKNRKENIEKLKTEGYINTGMQEKLMGLKAGATYQDLQSTMGVSGAHVLGKRAARRADPGELLLRSMKQYQKEKGTSKQAMYGYTHTTSALGSALTEEQRIAAWNVAAGEGGMTEKAYLSQRKAGEKIVAGRKTGVAGAPSGMGKGREITREQLIFEHGKKFADASVMMETAMINLAKDTIPIAVKGINLIGDSAKGLAEMINSLSKKRKGLTTAQQKEAVGDLWNENL